MAAAQVDAASKLLEAPGPSEVEEDSEDAVTTLLGAPEDIADDNKDDIGRKAPLLFIKDGKKWNVTPVKARRKSKMDVDEDDIGEEENEPQPFVSSGEKRAHGGDNDIYDSSDAKKLCSENNDESDNERNEETQKEKSATPCEVSITSIKSSNGSSTSTKTSQSVTLPETQSSDASSKTIQNSLENDASESDEVAAINEDETSKIDDDSATKDDDDIDETTSKLLASGISISLIKKKKNSQPEATNNDNEDSNGSRSEEPTTANPLEVGPHISVTMINKSSESKDSQESGKFKLSLKNPSDLLMNPSKSDSKTMSNILNNMEAMRDSISVSRINKSISASCPALPPSSSPAPSPSPHKTPRMSAQSIMMGALGFPVGPQGLAMMVSGPGGGPMVSMPGLQPRPSGPMLRPSQPQNSGSLSDQLSRLSAGLTDYMRAGMEDLLRELSAQGSPEATIKGLQLELEKMQWRHGQEMADMKQSVDAMLKDMKASLEKETQRTVDSLKKAAEVEKQKAINETKKKQWCANCSKEAIFYCCWNTSYCDYPCQQAHWPAHMSSCSQVGSEENSGEAKSPEHQRPVPPSPAQRRKQSLSEQMVTSLSMTTSLGMTPGLPGFTMPGMMGLRPGLGGMPGPGMAGRQNPLGVSIRPGMPGQLTISRPYFM